MDEESDFVHRRIVPRRPLLRQYLKEIKGLRVYGPCNAKRNAAFRAWQLILRQFGVNMLAA
jgi:hypothetical protein